MTQTNNKNKKLTGWRLTPSLNSWPLSSLLAGRERAFLNGLKKVRSFIAILAVMAIWLVSAASLAVAGEKTDIDIYALNTDRTLQGKTDGLEFTSKPVRGYNIVRTF